MEQEVVWVSSPTQGWSIGTITQIVGDTAIVQTNEGETIKSNKKDVLVFQDVHNSDVEDMITLQEAHEAIILRNLEQRFLKDQIYTYIGPVIISINPFKDVKNTGEKIINDYLTNPVDQLPPHLYAIAQNAYNSLITRGESQSIVISGESGAGKTEATKVILKFLTVACGRTSGGPKHTQELSQRILATNPVLEAFGNAKTVRNNNSSRFGKFISIAFDPGGSLNSASINNYLLETIRVVTQAPTERNYHVFYQLINGANNQERALYKLHSDASKYAYLKNGNIQADGMDDKICFSQLKQSLSTLGVDETEQQQIFTLLSGILHLGNVEFAGQDTVKVKDPGMIKLLCSLFKVQEDLMIKALTQRLFSSGGRNTVYNIDLTYPQALENRDALAKAMYSQLFDYLVERINIPLLGDNPPIDLNNDVRKFIGVLDIYGFEVFQSNSMEQFCINYANEKLHAQFNQHMFKAEQNMYTQEGVPWETIKFVDNQDCIDLIETSGGILSMLDEEGRVPRGADKTFLEKLVRKHTRNPRFKYNPRFPMLFGIEHYAGQVDYDVQGFLQKNKDTLNRDLVQVMATSDSKFMQDIFGEEPPPTNQKGTATRSKLTVCGRFQQSLSSLVQILSSSNRHYVRCIKPTDKLQPNQFVPLKVLMQLKSNGIFETIRMRKAGFASHITFDVFYKRFAFLSIKNDSKEAIYTFLQHMFTDKSLWVVGKTKVFLKDKSSEYLETERRNVYGKAVVAIQSHIRAYYQKQKLEALREQRRLYLRAIVIFQKHIRCCNAKQKLFILQQLYIRRQRAIITFQRYTRLFNARLKFIYLYRERQERLERERKERERLEKERIEKERLEKERLEKERKERERLEKERIEKERLENERIEKERKEKERLEKERIDKERNEKEKIRLENERKSRIAAEESQRLEKERIEKERLENERLEKERIESLEKEKIEKERSYRLERERLENQLRSSQKEDPYNNTISEPIQRNRHLSEYEQKSSRIREDEAGSPDYNNEPIVRDSSVRRRRDERINSLLTIQRHIRAWNCRRYAISLILFKFEELRKIHFEQENEMKVRILQAAREKGKIERKLPTSSLHQISIIEEQENTSRKLISNSDIIEDWNGEETNRQRISVIPKPTALVWEYSSPDRMNWTPFDDFTQEIIEKAYSAGEKEIILNHSFYAKDQYTVVFSGILSFRNNKTGNVRGIRRGGKDSYRTIYKLSPKLSPNAVKDPISRMNSNYRNVRKNNRKASIVAQIENFVSSNFLVQYSPEVYFLNPESVVHSSERASWTPIRNSTGNLSERFGIISPRGNVTSPRKYEDIEGYETERSKSRRRFGFPTDRPPEMRQQPSKSSFIPANKLKHPFRQVSRFWGSQRLRQAPKAGTTAVVPKKPPQTSLKQFLDAFNPGEDGNQNAPVSRRKIRSRSVPNLEALMSMSEQNEGKWGLISARSINTNTNTRARFGEYRSQYRNGNNA